VSIVGFTVLLISVISNWPNPVIGIVLWLTTSLFSAMAQIAMVQKAFPSTPAHWLPLLLISTTIGWMISWFLLLRLTNTTMNSDNLLAAGVTGGIIGGIIGLPPGLSSSLAYWLLFRSRFPPKPLILSNVLAWCLGMSIGFATLLTLLVYAFSNINWVG
jgi:hypothetical protein